MRHAVIILNQHAAAGRNRSVQVDYAALILQQMGFQTEIQKTIFAGQAIHLARSATTGPSDLIIAAGGDGTVNEVVSGRLQSNSPTTPIGILPFGTGNDVAQMLGLTSVDALLQGVENQEHVTWDALSVACDSPSGRVARAAVLFAAVGFASNLLEATTPRVKRWFGPKLCYSIGFFRALANFQWPRLQVRVNDKVWDEPLVVALAANAPKAGGGIMHLAPGAKMTDGQMNVSVRPTPWFPSCRK